MARRIEERAPIELVIPALPYKLSCPLKTRGHLPDLAEINFILGLYETVATIELLYREAAQDLAGPLARFTVVSDGRRFNRIVSEPSGVVEQYQAELERWIRRLHLEGHIAVVDYQTLLRTRLPGPIRDEKARLRSEARIRYTTALSRVFDPNAMSETLSAAARVEPDPEAANPQGRFVALLKSLIYTINYRSLEGLRRLPAARFKRLYRELTAHVFEPHALLSARALRDARARLDADVSLACTDPEVKECLRQAMLVEAWDATIEYLAEIKSDRELQEDPIKTCLPDHFRWTIHAKNGQLALLTATASGTPVQPWAGAPVFKRTKKNKIKLCTLPILALEGSGSIPVRVEGADWAEALGNQPMFYIDSDVGAESLTQLLHMVRTSLTRRRTS